MNPSVVQTQDSFFACGVPVIIREDEQGDTHAYHMETGQRLSETSLKYQTVYGGAPQGWVDHTSIRMESGLLKQLYGGSQGGGVRGRAEIRMTGGVIGQWLNGGGLDDNVGEVHIQLDGGVIRYGLAGAGESRFCGPVELDFANVTCAKIYTGTMNQLGLQQGGVHLRMQNGVIIFLWCGGLGRTTGRLELEISGGFVEKNITPLNLEGSLKLRLYQNFLRPGREAPSPLLPADADIEWLPQSFAWQFSRHEDHPQLPLSRQEDAGKLVMRFLELRHPQTPKDTVLFGDYIGDCILIRFPGGQQMMVDTGMAYSAPEVLSRLHELEITHLDYLLVTHYHGDHMGAAPAILSSCPVGQVLLPDMVVEEEPPKAMKDHLQLLDAIIDAGIPVRRVARGDQLVIGQGGEQVLLHFLNPGHHGIHSTDVNAQSVAFKLCFGQTSALLGADITDETEAELAQLYGEQLKADVLKLSHHAITHQSYYRYIDACSPSYVIVHNLREQGAFAGTTRYALIHVNHIPAERILMTGSHGLIRVALDGTPGGVSVCTQYTPIP